MTTFQNQLVYALGNRTKVFPELKKVFVRPLIQSKFVFNKTNYCNIFVNCVLREGILKIITVAVKAINQEHIEGGILDRISQKYNVPEEAVDEYYSIIFTILKVHLGILSQNVKPMEFKQTLEELKYIPMALYNFQSLFDVSMNIIF